MSTGYQTSIYDPHYETTALNKNQRVEYRNKNLSQSELILDQFKYKDVWSPSQLFKVFGMKYPITSIRRSLTNLTGSGQLIKLEDRLVEGMYGRDEHLWTIRR